MTAARSELVELLGAADASRTQGNLDEAVRMYLLAITLDADNTYARYWLATCYENAADLTSARIQCQAGLAVEPDQIGLLLRLASIAIKDMDPRLALDCSLRAAWLDPNIPDIDAMIADSYCFLGHVDDAIVHFDRALARNPESAQLQSNRLFVLNYTNLLSEDQRFEQHRLWGQQHESVLRQHWKTHPNLRRPDRRLKVGYVSGDLREHAVAIFLESLLARHDRQQFEVHCFDVSPYAQDAVTARLKNVGAIWHVATKLDDAAMADAIRSEQIDILVDLSGHTNLNRLLVFARRPAPVQVTWLGYLGTTGLTSMDYRITDKYLDPPGSSERYHTETLYRLPNLACFVPPIVGPPVNDLPALRNGYIKFASINQWPKVSTATKTLWAHILQAVPASRLMIVARGAQNPVFAREIAQDFERHGIDGDRVGVRPTGTLNEFLAQLHEVDITLDPFPYGGGTTTLHSLWMGVPVITLVGANAFGRNAIGPLTAVALAPQCVGATIDDYLERARSLAADVPLLRATRSSLRQRLLRSGMLEQDAFARQMEAAYRSMWQAWCAQPLVAQ